MQVAKLIQSIGAAVTTTGTGEIVIGRESTSEFRLIQVSRYRADRPQRRQEKRPIAIEESVQETISVESTLVKCSSDPASGYVYCRYI